MASGCGPEGARGMDETGTRGLRVLVVEDESLIAMLIEDALDRLGCTLVGVASNLTEALGKAASLDFDVAILDVNLNGAPVFPLAEVLAARGVPFVFSTGYGASGVPAAFAAAPVLAKPFAEADVASALAALRRDSGTTV
jgi:CheY-like chemotaxis protein